jgi:hypothetical protein
LADRRTDATLGNAVKSVFTFDLNNRLTRIRHAKDSTGLFDSSHGYDPVGDRRYDVA